MLILDLNQILDPRKPTPTYIKNLLTNAKILLMPPTYQRNLRNLANSHVRNIIALIISLNILFFPFLWKGNTKGEDVLIGNM